MNTEIVTFIQEWWPVLKSLGFSLFVVMSFGWRHVGRRIDALTTSVDALTKTTIATSTQVAIVQANLQTHTERDRESFHEIRNDVANQIAPLRASVETLVRAGLAR